MTFGKSQSNELICCGCHRSKNLDKYLFMEDNCCNKDDCRYNLRIKPNQIKLNELENHHLIIGYQGYQLLILEFLSFLNHCKKVSFTLGSSYEHKQKHGLFMDMDTIFSSWKDVDAGRTRMLISKYYRRTLTKAIVLSKIKKFKRNLLCKNQKAAKSLKNNFMTNNT